MDRPFPEGQSFERKIQELEAIVARLEGGDAPLEEALGMFERGTALLKELTSLLDAAEKRVDVLTRDADGAIRARPLEEGEEA